MITRYLTFLWIDTERFRRKIRDHFRRRRLRVMLAYVRSDKSLLSFMDDMPLWALELFVYGGRVGFIVAMVWLVWR